MYKIRGPKFLQSTILVLIIESKFVRSIGERHCEKFVKINCKCFVVVLLLHIKRALRKFQNKMEEKDKVVLSFNFGIRKERHVTKHICLDNLRFPTLFFSTAS